MKLVWETACHAPLSICWLKPVFFQGRQGPCLKKVLTRRPLNLQPWDHLRQQGLTTSEESLEETCFIKISFCFAQVFLTNHPKQETEKPAPKCFCGKISITCKSSEIFWIRIKCETYCGEDGEGEKAGLDVVPVERELLRHQVHPRSYSLTAHLVLKNIFLLQPNSCSPYWHTSSYSDRNASSMLM